MIVLLFPIFNVSYSMIILMNNLGVENMIGNRKEDSS